MLYFDNESILKYTGQKKLGIITFRIIFSGILNFTVYFNTSAYVAIIGLSFDKKLTVLSKSQTELCSVKYGIPEIFEFCLKTCFVVHMNVNAKLQTPSKSEQSNF